VYLQIDRLPMPSAPSHARHPCRPRAGQATPLGESAPTAEGLSDVAARDLSYLPQARPTLGKVARHTHR